LIPGPIRRLFFRLAATRPTLLKQFNGTVLVTSVGMYGKASGWGIPLAGHSLAVTVGGIEDKPVLQDGVICNRPHLRLTVTFDHDIIDGGPAARFIQRFVELVQAGAGLADAL
jgi:pyruvate/2-oxoglutarate dehydrogenase complex dihydrolipoamide acyltransferase (E2) component